MNPYTNQESVSHPIGPEGVAPLRIPLRLLLPLTVLVAGPLMGWGGYARAGYVTPVSLVSRARQLSSRTAPLRPTRTTWGRRPARRIPKSIHPMTRGTSQGSFTSFRPPGLAPATPRPGRVPRPRSATLGPPAPARFPARRRGPTPTCLCWSAPSSSERRLAGRLSSPRASFARLAIFGCDSTAQSVSESLLHRTTPIVKT